MEQTLAIIKPEAVTAGLMGEIIRRLENEHIRIAAMRMEKLDQRRAEGFYYVHRTKPFFASLVKYMSSGPVLLMVLQGAEVIKRWRELMGPTDPARAARGTIRGDFGSDIEHNAVHGSDSKDSAVYEINFFFKGNEIY
jgi:nucleoside-diphosphate kinase